MPERSGRFGFYDDQHSFLLIGWLGIAFALGPVALLAWVVNSPMAGPLTAAVAVVVALAGMLDGLAGGLRTGIKVDKQGVTEYYLVGRRHYPWRCIRDVTLDGQTGLLHTDRGVVEVDARVEDGFQLLRTVRECLDLDEPTPTGPMLPQGDIEVVLGVRPGGEVIHRVGPVRWRHTAFGMVPWLLLPVLSFIAMALVDGWAFRPAMLLGFAITSAAAMAVLGLTRVAAAMEDPEVAARGDGLILRGRGLFGTGGRRRIVPWHQVRLMRRDGPYREIKTDQGDVLIHTGERAGRRVADAVERVLAARAEGWALPSGETARMTGVHPGVEGQARQTQMLWADGGDGSV